MKSTVRSLSACCALAAVFIPATSQAASPEVSNIRATQRAGTKLVDIYYDVTDPENDPLTVAIQIYDGGSAIPTYTVSGDVGSGVTAGANKHIIWNAGQDWNRRLTNQGKARILVDDLSITSPSASMSFVPGGFGTPTGSSYEIYTSGFYMDKLEVSKALWDTVYQWAITNGYSFDNAGTAYGSTHPINGINWYDAIKWSNARSQKEGLTPCYYTNSARTSVYKAGQVVLDNNWVSWEANGYRLPTTAEWIKAYRGGQGAGAFPWPSYWGSTTDNIHPGLANYSNSNDPHETAQSSGYATTPAGYYNGGQTPSGPDNKNGFGLYDMAGNVGEWCWDRDFTSWYSSYAEARDDNSKGPNLGQGSTRFASGSMSYSYFSGQGELPATSKSTVALPLNFYGGSTPIGLRCLRSK
jgi:formylglycine-generating enzyme